MKFSLQYVCCTEYSSGFLFSLRSIYGRLQAKRWRLCFLIPKIYTISPVKNNGSPRCRWQTHKRLGCGLCYRETFRKFLTRARIKKWWSFQYPAYSRQSVTDGKRTLRRVPFRGAKPTRYQQQPQTGELQTRNNFRVPDIHFIHPIRRG